MEIGIVANIVLLGFSSKTTKSLTSKIEKCGSRVIEIANQQSRLKMSLLIVNYTIFAEESMLCKYAAYKKIPIIKVIKNDSDIGSFIDKLHPEEGDLMSEDCSVKELAATMKRCLIVSDIIRSKNQKQKKLQKNAKRLRIALKSLQQDQKAAKETQFALSPRSPAVYGDIVFRHLLLPSHYASGDFIQYSRMLNDRVLFYLLDVSGHGVASAFVTVMARQLIASSVQYLLVNDDKNNLLEAPKSFLPYINNEFYKSNIEKHLTMFIGSLDIITLELNYVIGGHTPAPMLVTDDKAEFLPGNGPPLGLYEDADWQQQKLQLPEKFKIVCFSDGIYDLIDAKTIAQKNRLLLNKTQNTFRSLRALMYRFKYSKSIELLDDISTLTIEKS